MWRSAFVCFSWARISWHRNKETQTLLRTGVYYKTYCTSCIKLKPGKEDVYLCPSASSRVSLPQNTCTEWENDWGSSNFQGVITQTAVSKAGSDCYKQLVDRLTVTFAIQLINSVTFCLSPLNLNVRSAHMGTMKGTDIVAEVHIFVYSGI
jgi:hypothetical protein